MIKVTDKQFYMDGFLVDNLEFYKKRREKKWDNVLLCCGDEGCLTGDTEININRASRGGKYKLNYIWKQYNKQTELTKDKMWNLDIPTYVRSYDGESIRLHKIKDVVYSGKKEVTKLTLINGRTITATKDHKIMTKEGWKELQELSFEDYIMCDTLLPQKGKQKSFKMKDASLKVNYHPYKNVRNEVEVHRLAYESHLNGLSFMTYLDILWNDEGQSQELKFINPQEYHIHHKDGNHYNNSRDNLELIEATEHIKLHSKEGEGFRNFNQGTPTYSRMKMEESVGIKPTYDIVCEDPYRNFVANGIVVHNSGKTTLAGQVGYYMDPDYKLDNVAFNRKQIDWCLDSLPPGSTIQFDEFGIEGSSGDSLSTVQKILTKKITTIRKKKYTIIVVVAFPWMLKTYFVLRSQAMIRAWSPDNLTRGKFLYYCRPKMKRNYFYGLQSAHKWEYMNNRDFAGDFRDTTGMFYKPEEYEAKKDEAIGEIGKENLGITGQRHKERLAKLVKAVRPHFKAQDIANILGVDHSYLAKLEKSLEKPSLELDSGHPLCNSPLRMKIFNNTKED